MQEKLKSTFFMKKLFFHLNERRKLKLIKYNKSIQKDLDIGLINYLYFTKKYIIYETKEKEKNIIDTIVNYFMKENIYMEKEMEKGKNMIIIILN